MKLKLLLTGNKMEVLNYCVSGELSYPQESCSCSSAVSHPSVLLQGQSLNNSELR